MRRIQSTLIASTQQNNHTPTNRNTAFTITFNHACAAHEGTAYRAHYRLMADPWRRLLLFYCFGLHVYCCVHRAHAGHAILGNARRASRERELLELRILHERQHLVYSEHWPVPEILTRTLISSIVQLTAIALAASHRAHT